METITSDEYRNGIRVLMVEYLGLRWARANIPAGYGLYPVPDAREVLPAVPEAMLPALYARAQADAMAVLDAEEAMAA